MNDLQKAQRTHATIAKVWNYHVFFIYIDHFWKIQRNVWKLARHLMLCTMFLQHPVNCNHSLLLCVKWWNLYEVISPSFSMKYLWFATGLNVFLLRFERIPKYVNRSIKNGQFLWHFCDDSKQTKKTKWRINPFGMHSWNHLLNTRNSWKILGFCMLN